MDTLLDEKNIVFARVKQNYRIPYQIVDTLRKDTSARDLKDQQQENDYLVYLAVSILATPFLFWPLMYFSTPDNGKGVSH